MRLPIRSAAITIILAALSGAGGIWLGGRFLHPEAGSTHSLHEMVHEELKLSRDQERQIEGLEAAFAVHKEALEGEMRKANAELATAIRTNESAGADVTAAVHHFHDAMGVLQSVTIEHVFAMRKILTPEQRALFDDKIAQALTSSPE